MQVDPIRPTLKAPGTKRLKLIYDAPLSIVAFDLNRRRYTEGNEYSYYMLLTSSYILNHAERVGQFKIHPWIHNNNNHLSDADQLRDVAGTREEYSPRHLPRIRSSCLA